MTIDVYSKKGCGICDAAKDKLARLGLQYKNQELQAMIEPHQGWREDNSVDLLAAYAMIGNRLPVIKINDEYHDYPSAMRRLKGLGTRAAVSTELGSEGTH